MGVLALAASVGCVFTAVVMTTVVLGADVFRVVCGVISGRPAVGTLGWTDDAIVGTAVQT